MKKISEYKNDDALDLLVDLIEPVAEILADKEMISLTQGKGRKIDAVKVAIKNHKDAVIKILARLDQIPVEEANYNIITITSKLLEVLNDQELMDFFTSQQPQKEEKSFGAVTEITKAKEK